jgi:tyrosine aminotransferase
LIHSLFTSVTTICERKTADSTFPHLPPCREATEAIVQALIHKPHTACYTHASGSPEARRAIALHHSFPGHNLNPQNVIVTNGCSGALELTLSTILDEGTTLLVPQPGLPLYEEIAESHGANVVRYRLDPNRRWECDMNHLEEIMAGSISNKSIIRAMVINNPSSHGSVFSENHLEQLLDFALKHRIPIVADEVYGNLTFGSNRFHPIAKVAVKHGRKVPVITTSGLSKQFLLPGWRIGWCTFQDNTHGSLREVERGAHRINKFLHGVSHLQQSVIPIMLSQSTAGLVNWKENLRATLERQANILCSNLNNSHCLNVAPPQGSMYTIVDLDPDRLDIDNDIEFTQKLVQEENVFVLPGSSFGVPDTFRVAFSASETILEMASQRILDFCSRHRKLELKEEKIR